MMHRTQLTGYRWQLGPEEVPRLITAVRLRQICTDTSLYEGCIPYWLLACSYTQLGHVRFGTGSAPWSARPAGTCMLVPPRVRWWEDVSHMTGRVMTGGWIWFHCRYPLVAGPRLAHDDTGALHRMLLQIARVGHQQGESGFWQAQACFMRAFEQLRRVFGDTPPRTGSPRDADLVSRVDACLRERLHERVHVDEVARHMHVSRSSLMQRYRRTTGLTIHIALMQMRVESARRLLQQGQPLKQIAAATGFTDAAHLSRSFKQATGHCPRDYLRQLVDPSMPPSAVGARRRSRDGVGL